MTADTRHSVLADARGDRQIHHAGWVVVDVDTVIKEGFIEVEDHVIQAVHTRRPSGTIVNHGPGVLMPPLVNAHLHLELSALKGMLPLDKGFKTWVSLLLEKREALGRAYLTEKAHQAALTMQMSGNLCVGDISTLGITAPVLETVGLSGVCFHEYLGTDIGEHAVFSGPRLSCSLAGHAPHSSSPELLRTLKLETRQNHLPFSIHVAESADETVFIREKKGLWADFLTLRGIDFSDWDIGAKTPLAYVHGLGLLDKDTIVVHALNMDAQDMALLSHAKAQVCLCPRSNLNLHQKLPDISGIMALGIEPALGTDSLASCNSLDILDEMQFVRHHFPHLTDTAIFLMGTVNGARALGIDHFCGTLASGNMARFLYLPVTAEHQTDLFRKMICDE